jgi:outer membrane protein OmpA-like peptidoglycan-associated protein
MPPSSAVARSLALALPGFGLGAADASAQIPPSYSGLFADAAGGNPAPPAPGLLQSRLVAVAAPMPLPAAPMPATPSGPIVRVLFASQSAELTADARAELDRAAVTLAQTRTRPLELRAYAGSASGDGRKKSLARALAVRGYLIEHGVKGTTEVSANLAQSGAATSDRVDIVVRGPQ